MIRRAATREDVGNVAVFAESDKARMMDGRHGEYQRWGHHR
jgi:hypothetical protein